MSPTDRRTFMIQSAGALSAMAIAPSELFAGTIARADVSVGIIGAGRHGRAIMAELQRVSGVKIAALCDVEESRLNAAMRRAEGAEGFRDHREMLDKRKDIAAVIVATPSHLHHAPCVDALGAGKHVYCETPLAHTIEDCQFIAQAAAGSKSIFAVGCEGRANPVYKLARTFFRTDAIRDVVRLRAQSNRKTNWRVPAPNAAAEAALNWRLDPAVSTGLAGELGAAQFDVMMWFTGLMPESVRGWGVNRAYLDENRAVPDTIGLEFTMTGGVRLQYEATLANSYEGRYEALYGVNGAMRLAWSHGWMFKEADAPTQGWEVYANRQAIYSDEGITLIADATKLASQGKLKEGIGLPFPALYYPLADFLKCVTEGGTPACGVADGARAAAMGILGNQAVRLGETIEFDADTMRGF